MCLFFESVKTECTKIPCEECYNVIVLLVQENEFEIVISKNNFKGELRIITILPLFQKLFFFFFPPSLNKNECSPFWLKVWSNQLKVFSLLFYLFKITIVHSWAHSE